MNIRGNQAALFACGSRGAQNNALFGRHTDNTQKNGNIVKQGNAGQDPRLMKRMLGQSEQSTQNDAFTGGIVESTFSYGDSIRAARMKAKNTALQLKKVKYEFKSLSTQIMQSKTSNSARQVASKARREVLRLKNQRQSGEYDSEELQEAIAHAESMERVARKKARHLQEEEMVKVTGGPCAGELEEKEEQRDASLEDEASQKVIAQQEGGENGYSDAADIMEAGSEALREQMQSYEEIVQMQAEALQEEMQARMAETQWSMEEMMSELMDEMNESMEEMLKNSGLEELADTMFASAETEMDPADLKMMKIKHRSEEMKEIAKADAKYLKAMFDRLERMKQAGGSGISLGNGMSGGGSGFSADSSGMRMSVPVQAMSMPSSLSEVSAEAVSADGAEPVLT